MLEWAKMQSPRKEYLADTSLVTATTTGACSWSFALSSNLSTIFQEKDRLKTTRMHPWSKYIHLIDYVLVHKRDLKDVIPTKVMPSAECHTDHRLVSCKIRLYFKPKPRTGGPPRKSSIWTNFSQLKWKLTFWQAYSLSLKTATAQKHFFWNTLWSTEECHPADIWRGSGVYH